MDFNLKQWRTDHHHHHHHHDSETEDHQTSSSSATTTKFPKLLQLNSHPIPSASDQALPLFAPEPSTKLPREHAGVGMGSYFNIAQWQELELQALIYRHMIAGAAIPPELLHLVKKSLVTHDSSTQHYLYNPLYHHPYYSHYQPAPLVQSGYWGRGAMDPEPGRCRRTDGKKWRCSRDVVTGQKYCERHMHRGRNRSRKPVETTTSTITTNTNNASPYGGNGGSGDLKTNSLSVASQGLSTAGGGGASHFTLSGPSPSLDLLQLNRRDSDSGVETKYPFQIQNDGQAGEDRTLRHFIDDWPRSIHGSENTTTNLSISMPGNSSSDFSLKLGTGNADDLSRDQVVGGERDRPQWTWGPNMMAPMGGPLAEALRSSISTSSPTSVLHRLSRGSTSEASYITS